MENRLFTYEEMIALGFKRYDYSDTVDFDRCGYHPFCLDIKLGKELMIEYQSLSGDMMLYRGTKKNHRFVRKIKTRDELAFLMEIFGKEVK